MANRGYSGSNVMLVRNESSTDMSLVAMLASCSPVALQAQRADGGLEDAVPSCGQKRFFSPTFETSTGEDPGEEDTGDDCTQHSVEKKRRLSFDQVRSLEKSFEIENKLEPERKMQLAKDLGLMPRQVAVWFQNRRARWKTKQLERDYDVLTADYNRLKTDYDAVLEEKQKVQIEIDCLTGKLQTAQAVIGDLPEKDKKSKTPSKESVKQEMLPELTNGTNEARKEEGSGSGSGEGSSRETISSGSASSEILNVDSPRTMDSGAPAPLVVPINLYPEIDSNAIIHFQSDNLCDQMLPPLDCSRIISVKPEDGSFQDDSCNYILSRLEDEKGLPWWEWP